MLGEIALPHNDTVPRYRADIDGLRAIAVSAVVLFHAGAWPFTSGYVGVDVFFVISGFLIGGIILRETGDGTFGFGRFYARRARRILPALFAAVLATCLAGWFLLSPSDLRDLAATAASSFVGMSNFSFYRFNDYFHPDSQLIPLLMTWSLAVEEQFYLFFPLLMLGIGRLPSRWTLPILVSVTLASFLAGLWATHANPTAAFFLLPYRAWELGVGVILAWFEHERGARHATARPAPFRELAGAGGMAALVASIVAFSADTPFPGTAAIVPVLGTAALIWANGSWVNRVILSWPPVVFVGLISYSWYLWHWPLMSLARNVAFDEPPAATMLLVAALSFGVAILSYRFVEQPFRRGAIRVRPVLLGYGAALAVAVGIATTLKLGQGFPAHVPSQVRQIEAAHDAEASNPCLAGWDDRTPNVSPRCVVERVGRPSVVLIGDSHAGALDAGVRMAADRQDWGYQILTKSACAPLVGVTVWRRAQPSHAANCAAFMRAAFERAASDPNVETVILAGLWPNREIESVSAITHFLAESPADTARDGYDLFRTGLRRAVDGLVAAGKHVIIMGDVPHWRFDASRVATTQAMKLRAVLARFLWSAAPRDFPDPPGRDLVEPADERNEAFFRSLEQPGKVAYVDLLPRFCSSDTCVFSRDGTLLVVDTGHLSEAGARHALQGLALRTDGNAPIAD